MTADVMTEKEWQARVVDLAKVMGWRFAHFRPAQTARGWRTAMEGMPGFPDLVLVRAGRVIFAELKAGKNKPGPEQVEWINQLAAVPGVDAYVWWPQDWDQVVEALTGRQLAGGAV